VEGHTAGASAERLPALAAGGLTSDHEPITARGAGSRTPGNAVMLRESSLRPDLRGLLDAPRRRRDWPRGPCSPPTARCPRSSRPRIRRPPDPRGFERGVPPIDACRMATLNPATYGRDHEVAASPRSLCGPVRAGRSERAAPGDGGGPRAVVATGGRLTTRVPEAPWARAFTSSAAGLTVRWRAREDFAPLPRALSGDAPGERGDPRSSRAPARRGRSLRRPRGSRGCWAPGVVTGFAGARRSGLDDHHRLQHPRPRAPRRRWRRR
jgi:adenine deaminase